MSTLGTQNGRETSTKGPRIDPPKRRGVWVALPENLQRSRNQPPTPPGTRRPMNRNHLFGGVAAAIILVLLILVLSGGSGTTKIVRGAVAFHPKEVELKSLGGITGVTVKAVVTPLTGASVQLTVSASSQYSYTAYLITPPTKIEPLFSNAEGESHFVHKLTIQHLLGYHYLRIYILESGATQARAAAQIPTSNLVEGIIAH
jgi:hypothetical protein